MKPVGFPKTWPCRTVRATYDTCYLQAGLVTCERYLGRLGTLRVV